MNEAKQYNMGPQPLDALMSDLGVENGDLVRVSTEHLTHKMVQKGRKGRRLTRNVQMKILNAVNAVAAPDRTFALRDLFDYR